MYATFPQDLQPACGHQEIFNEYPPSGAQGSSVEGLEGHTVAVVVVVPMSLSPALLQEPRGHTTGTVQSLGLA